ncbi:MAG: hypothetical protein CMF52_03810 [Legionellales bacterium]|nr:hypothetical protein [Legionellales bacterium]|tara:strand:+ start:947 stop:1126 length:180 start_codon:yes stop_codon:yes gene_type:complete
MNKDGPLLQAFDNLPQGIVRQELTSYFMRDGQLIKQTVERTFNNAGDYIDSTSVVPLTK